MKRARAIMSARLFKREGSRFWQVRIRVGEFSKRISTGKVLRVAAAEFAQLALRHYDRKWRGLSTSK